MEFLSAIVKFFTCVITVLFQQALIFGFGYIIMAQHSQLLGSLFMLLSIPMIYVNIQTVKMIYKYGVINFFTMNADTSEIDVPKGDRWYDQ